MKKRNLILLTVLIFLPLFLFSLSKTAVNNEFRKNPYLIFNQNPADITIIWQNYFEKKSKIIVYRDEIVVDSTQISQNTEDHLFYYNFRAEDGRINYRYKVITGKQQFYGNFYSCPNDSAKEIKFYVYGDTRSFPENHNMVAKAICDDFSENTTTQTFIISTGDLVKHGNREEDWDEQFFNGKYKFIVKMLSNLPYISAQGNHERNGELFRKYFPYNRGEKHWFFNYGPVHIVMFNEYEDYSLNSNEIRWLRNDLKSTNKKWKILVMHEPGWSAGGHQNNKKVQEIIQPICKEFNVPIVFNGHNHYYSRAFVDGVYYITSGGGGAPLYDPNPNFRNVQVVKKDFHFCKVEIMSNKIKVKIIDIKNKTIDEFEISGK